MTPVTNGLLKVAQITGRFRFEDNDAPASYA